MGSEAYSAAMGWAAAAILARRGRTNEAEAEYKAALMLSPQFAPAAVNLADLYRQLGRDTDGETTLRVAITTSPRDAALHYALGLTLTRLKQTDAALAELSRAAELEPARARYSYVYAVALQSSGRREEALSVLKNALAKHLNDRDILTALINFSREAGDIVGALEYAERLTLVSPNPELARVIEDLRRQATKPNPR